MTDLIVWGFIWDSTGLIVSTLSSVVQLKFVFILKVEGE